MTTVGVQQPSTSPSMRARVLPWTQEGEMSVLGGVLLHPRTWNHVVGKVAWPEFYHPAHSAIFRAMTELDDAGKPIDAITVAEQMRANDTFHTLRAFNGEGYFAELTNAVVTIENLPFHASIVRGKARVRKLIEVSQQHAARGYGEYGDVNDFLNDAARAVVDIAQDSSVRPAIRVDKLMGDVVRRMQERSERRSALIGFATGYDQFDFMIGGLEPSTLVVIAGRPSNGKSSFTRDAVVGAMLNSGVPTLWFSPEMSKENVLHNTLCSQACIDTRQTVFDAAQWTNIYAAVRTINELPWSIDDSEAPTMSEIRAKARRWRFDLADGGRLRKCACGHGFAWHDRGNTCQHPACRGACTAFAASEDGDLGDAIIVVDYLQRIDAEKKQGENDAKAVGNVAKGLKSLAKELRCTVIAISSLSRAVMGRENKRPMMSDIRESGDIEYEADVIAFMYRDELYNKETTDKGIAEVIIDKQRNGPLGTVHLEFLAPFTRFQNLRAERGPAEQQELLPANPSASAPARSGGGQ